MDWCTDPSTALRVQPPTQNSTQSSESAEEDCPLFSPEKEALHTKRYEEQYDLVDDPEYIVWLNNHLEGAPW